MPELPEVATMIAQTRPHILERRIVDVKVAAKGERLIGDLTPQALKQRLQSRKIIDIGRHGKFIQFHLDNNARILAHLRMSGRFTITQQEIHPSPHNRLQVVFEDANVFNFLDIRRFATFHYLEPNSESESLSRLGPDALTDEFNGAYLAAELANRSKNIYSALLDQNIVAGLGNIYVNELLLRVGISPGKAANKIDRPQLEQLVTEAKLILQAAVDHQGTTLIDKSYRTVEGGYGNYAEQLKAYGRAGKLCQLCGKAEIMRIKIGGRSVYYCPVCQN